MVQAGGFCADPFVAKRGVLQGVGTSPDNFINFIRIALCNIHRRCQRLGIFFIPSGTWHSYSAFADDIKGLVRPNHVQLFLQIVEEELAALGLTLNRDKTELLVISDRPVTETSLAGFELQRSSKVLGLVYDTKLTCNPMFRDRLQRGQSKVTLHASRLKKFGCTESVDI